MNKLLYVIFTVQLVLVTIADVLACVWLGTAGSEWYLKQPGNATNSDTGYQLPNFIGYWFTFFGLFNNFVPMFVRCVVWCVYPSGKLGAQTYQCGNQTAQLVGPGLFLPAYQGAGTRKHTFN